MLSEFQDIIPELMPKFGVGRLVFGGGGVFFWGGGGGFGGGGGGGGEVCFQSLFAFNLSAAVSYQVSFFRFFAR